MLVIIIALIILVAAVGIIYLLLKKMGEEGIEVAAPGSCKSGRCGVRCASPGGARDAPEDEAAVDAASASRKESV